MKNLPPFIFVLVQPFLDKRTGDLIGGSRYIPIMEFETFREFFQFVPTCLCGKQLITEFTYSASMDDDYTFIAPARAYEYYGEQQTFVFPFQIDSRVSPYGKIEFDMRVKTDSPAIVLSARSLDTSNEVDPLTIAQKHFTYDVQQKLNINMHRICPGPCDSGYVLSTNWFGFDLSKFRMKPIRLLHETFSIKENNIKYIFSTGILYDKTIISYPIRKNDPLSDKEEIVMSATKFLKYPREREFLLNKLRTLLLFC